MGETFVDKHGYAQGTYENKLDANGHNSAEIIASGKYGKNINPGEYDKIMAEKGNPYKEGQASLADKISGVDDKMNQLTGEEFAWDYTEFLPGIQKEAASIYDPQQAQLKAMREFGQLQGEQAKVETNEQFDKRMQQETESINNRGAYFSGGAVQNEQNIRTEQGRALNQITLQTQAADLGMQAQQALMTAEETKYIKDQLIDNQASAYNRWFNERGFTFGVLQEQRANYSNDKKEATDVFQADRAFGAQQEQFKLNYDMNQKEFDLAKDKYNTAKDQWGEEMAFMKFKYFDAKASKGSSKKSDSDKANEWLVDSLDTFMKGNYADSSSYEAGLGEMADLLGSDYVDVLEGADIPWEDMMNAQMKVKQESSDSTFGG